MEIMENHDDHVHFSEIYIYFCYKTGDLPNTHMEGW